MRAIQSIDLPPSLSFYREELESLPAPALSTVEEVMARDVLAVRPDMDLRTAAELLLENAISGMPVVDEQNQLLGMVSKTDMMRHRLENGEESVSLSSDQHVLEDTTVADVMTRQVLTVLEGTSLVEAAKLMVTAGVHRVPVVSPEGALVGLVTTSDFVRWVAGLP